MLILDGKESFFEKSKISKIFANFEVTNFKNFLGIANTLKLSQNNFEVDNFIFSEKIQFFPKIISRFWAIPLFFAHF